MLYFFLQPDALSQMFMSFANMPNVHVSERSQQLLRRLRNKPVASIVLLTTASSVLGGISAVVHKAGLLMSVVICVVSTGSPK